MIERVLGSGGFGITYLARDTRLGRQVVIKENLPGQFCFRDTHSLTVAPSHTDGNDVENFRWSLENFAKEAAMLASLDHPGIVKVLRSFEAFDTAYFVMPFVEGITLDKLVMSRHGKPFSENELCAMLERLLGALGYLHDRKIYHRDIKPSNLLITNDGMPVLIDFGSARQRLSERSMTVIESAGYTPFEQLQSSGNVGPWSDLYAAGATVVKIMTGEAPPKTNDRSFVDLWIPLTGRAVMNKRFSVGFLACVDRSLRLPVEERWQNAGEWLSALHRNDIPDTIKPALIPITEPYPNQSFKKEIRPAAHKSQISSKKLRSISWILASLGICGLIALLSWYIYPPEAHDAQKVQASEQANPYVNSLGMRFMPVKITGGPSDGQQLLFSIWETRVQDYRKFAAANNALDEKWKNPGFAQTEEHPVTCVNYEDAMSFCEWLTLQEKKEGKIAETARYRLPTDHEWSCAVGIGDLENATATPESKDEKLPHAFPWAIWPPPKGAGNYDNSVANSPLNTDSFVYTSPVGGFPPSVYGLFDLGGNELEWCDTTASSGAKVLRGGSWRSLDKRFLLSSKRIISPPDSRDDDYGFRCVLELDR